MLSTGKGWVKSSYKGVGAGIWTLIFLAGDMDRIDGWILIETRRSVPWNSAIHYTYSISHNIFIFSVKMTGIDLDTL
jgi:hypothetical protein